MRILRGRKSYAVQYALLSLLFMISMEHCCGTIVPQTWVRGTEEDRAMLSSFLQQTNGMTCKLGWWQSHTNRSSRQIQSGEVAAVIGALSRLENDVESEGFLAGASCLATISLISTNDRSKELRVVVGWKDRVFVFREAKNGDERIFCFRCPGLTSYVETLMRRPGTVVTEVPSFLPPDPTYRPSD